MLILRNATINDIDILFHWRNDPDVRNASFNTEEVPYETHTHWYKNALDRDDIEIFIMEEDGVPVGQIRLTYWYDELVISYSIDRNFRGRHMGQNIVSLMEEKLLKDPKVRKDGEFYVAYVKKENIVSRRVFEVLKYREIEQRKWMKYIKAIPD